MPLTNLFKNSIYYWGFAAAVGYPLVHPLYTAPGRTQVIIGTVGWALSQLTNFAVHAQLAGMRGEEGDTARAPPGGLLFSLVTSPNYTAEVAGWISWSLLSQISGAYVFTLFGLGQMTDWALKKYREYKKTDQGKVYTKGRKAIIPFII